MIAGGGKSKGSEFERVMAGELSNWLSHGTDKNTLWRTASSGGRSTQFAKSGTLIGNQAGDLSAVAPLGHKLIDKFVIELKFYKDLGVQNIVYETNTGLMKFWEKLQFECKTYSKFPMLIAKQNFQPEIVCLNKEGAKLLDISLTSDIWRVYVPRADMWICFLKDFLETASTNRL